MPTMTKEGRLAEIRQRIDDLEARARNGTPETQARLQRRFDALRDDADAATVALEEKADAVEERFVELESRVDIAAKREAAEMTSDATSFADAVEAELRDWDAAIERMQVRAAVKAYNARDRAETSVAELRQARNRTAERLAEARSSSGEAWEEQKKRVTAALDDLEQKAREARRSSSEEGDDD
jgi:polyhydroxyalkanoate synthesis regulator phasin